MNTEVQSFAVKVFYVPDTHVVTENGLMNRTGYLSQCSVWNKQVVVMKMLKSDVTCYTCTEHFLPRPLSFIIYPLTLLLCGTIIRISDNKYGRTQTSGHVCRWNR